VHGRKNGWKPTRGRRRLKIKEKNKKIKKVFMRTTVMKF